MIILPCFLPTTASPGTDIDASVFVNVTLVVAGEGDEAVSLPE